MNKKLYLIGTIHQDIDGPGRLEKLLEFINPDTVCVEINEKGEKIFEEFNKDDRNVGFLDTILELARVIEPNSDEKRDLIREYFDKTCEAVGYEFWVSRDYVSFDKSRNLVYIDPPDFSPDGLSLDESGKAFQIALEDPVESTLIATQMLNSDLLANDRENINSMYEHVTGLMEKGLHASHLVEKGIHPITLEKLDPKSPQGVLVSKVYSYEREDHMVEKIRESSGEGYRVAAVMGIGHLGSVYFKLEDLDPVMVPLHISGDFISTVRENSRQHKTLNS